jgi:cation:H+ antiporter
MGFVTALQSWPLAVQALLFAGASICIGIFGVRMTHVARRLAQESGLGEAIVGAVFIGAATSLSGIVASISAASQGHAELAVSNSLGGIAAQTLFLAVADMFYRRANLEHAAASAENLMMCASLLTLLALLLVAFAVPDLSIRGIHPVTPILLVSYLATVRVLTRTHARPMWFPRRTRETRVEKKTRGRRSRKAALGLWLRFAALGAIVGTAGWILSLTGAVIAEATSWSQGLVGGVLIAIATSLPELVVAVTAVRHGALTLAVGDIIGGNAFDTLFIAGSDLAYREGPIYAAVSEPERIWLAICVLMTGVLLIGLIHRERRGFAAIGTESVLLIVIYLGGLGLLTMRG